GKPHPPIYDLALMKLSEPHCRRDLLAIGDGIDTDIKGAYERGIDAIYVASRVHIKDAAGPGAIGQEALERLFAGRPFRPRGALLRLAWRHSDALRWASAASYMGQWSLQPLAKETALGFYFRIACCCRTAKFCVRSHHGGGDRTWTFFRRLACRHAGKPGPNRGRWRSSYV